MLIVYDSLTGNVNRFINKVKLNNLKLSSELILKEPFILITYTTGFGQVPETTAKFLNNNHQYLKGVVSSGNTNWGKFFGNAANIISDTFNVPLIMKFEMSGTEQDVEKFLQEVKRIDNNLNS